jgi:hypothetical protein
MKKILIPAMSLILFTSLVVSSKIDGKWKGSVETDEGPFYFTVTYNVVGDSLSGRFDSDYGTLDFSGGKVTGDEFEYSFYMEGYKIDQKGKLISDDEIEITYQDDYGENTIKLTRVPEEQPQ